MFIIVGISKYFKLQINASISDGIEISIGWLKIYFIGYTEIEMLIGILKNIRKEN